MSGAYHKPSGPGSLSEELLMAYLGGKLSGDELHAVEQLLAGEGMESDALEGLQDFDAAEARAVTTSLNSQLQHSLKKKRRRSRRGIAEQRWAWMAIALVLLLAAAGFAVFWVKQHP